MSRSFIIESCIAILTSISSFGQVQDSTVNHPLEKQKTKKWRRSEWIVPSSLIVTGSLLALNKSANEYFFNNHEVCEKRNEHFKNFSFHADDYLQYTPIATTFALSLSGVKGKNDLLNQTCILVKTELLMLSIVIPLKIITAEPRPDSGTRNSFPSGHTTEAFVAATFLAKEYGHKSIWYSIGAYTAATSVGVLRVLNNRHWLSDVVAGAGIGILTTNIVYATHQHKWSKKNKNNLTVAPTYQYKSTGVYLSYKF